MVSKKKPFPSASTARYRAVLGDFVTLAARFAQSGGAVSHAFPLRGKVRMRSNLTLSFQGAEVARCDKFGGKTPKALGRGECPTLWLNILTLAGVGGALPLRVTEAAMRDGRAGGDALHAFLDILNYRFWELLFVLHCVSYRSPYGCGAEAGIRQMLQSAAALSGVAQIPSWLLGRTSPQFPLIAGQYCFGGDSGVGSASMLGEFLTITVGNRVVVKEFQSTRITVPSRYRAGIGRKTQQLGRDSILGATARMRCGVALILHLPESRQSSSFDSLLDRAKLDIAVTALSLIAADSLSVVKAQIRINTLEKDRTSILGGDSCRLAWGAILLGVLSATQLIGVSGRAIHEMNHRGRHERED